MRRVAVPIAMGLVATLTLPVIAAGARPSADPVVAPVAPGAPAVPMAAPSPDLPGLAAMSTELTAVTVDGAAFRRASSSYAEVATRHSAAQDARVSIDRSTTALAGAAAAQRAELVAATASRRALQNRLGEVDAAIAELSIQLYVSGGSTARVDAALTQENPSINDHDRRAVLGTSSMDVLLAERAAYRQRVSDAAARADAAQAALDEATAARHQATQARGAAVAAEAQAASIVAEERVRYEEARALATVEGVDFTLVALDAYHRAARAVDADDPGCGIRWWALAGISRVEGRHGTYGGAALDARGDATRRIIGIQLNGTNETAVVGDSDGGALDGDAAFDRAVGPMQFIPQTWQRFASDGNEDDLATPFNMYDATLAAARYLCTASKGLAVDDGLRSAYFSYNRSLAYVDQVLRFARGYERAIDLPDGED